MMSNSENVKPLNSNSNLESSNLGLIKDQSQSLSQPSLDTHKNLTKTQLENIREVPRLPYEDEDGGAVDTRDYSTIAKEKTLEGFHNIMKNIDSVIGYEKGKHFHEEKEMKLKQKDEQAFGHDQNRSYDSVLQSSGIDPNLSGGKPSMDPAMSAELKAAAAVNKDFSQLEKNLEEKPSSSTTANYSEVPSTAPPGTYTSISSITGKDPEEQSEMKKSIIDKELSKSKDNRDIKYPSY
jgi:hypothetical protein